MEYEIKMTQLFPWPEDMGKMELFQIPREVLRLLEEATEVIHFGSFDPIVIVCYRDMYASRGVVVIFLPKWLKCFCTVFLMIMN